MPQATPYQSVNPANKGAPTRVDLSGNLLTGSGSLSTLNVTAATVIKATPGRIARVSVVVAGSAVGAIYDHATTSGVAVANQIGVIPVAVGSYDFSLPCGVGIVVVPPTGATVAVSYS